MNDEYIKRLIRQNLANVKRRAELAERGMVIIRSWPVSICLSCANIFTAPIKPQHKCPLCGHVMPRKNYEEIVQAGRDAILFGHIYRSKYEDNYRKNKKGCHYGLSIDYTTLTLLSFIGVAALSGVIGNASYDIVKAIIQRIARSSPVKRRLKDESKAVYLSDLYSERFIQRLIAHTRDHHNGFRNAPRKVRDAISSEIRAQTVAPTVQTGRLPKKEMIIRRRPLLKSDARRLWKNMDKK